MPERIDPKKIFQTLADRLPEHLLQELFPGSSPGDIREFLRNSGNFTGWLSGASPGKHATAQPPEKTCLPLAGGCSCTCSLYTDGASRGNPGDAGAGIVLFDGEGNELLARSFYLGKCTNNAAEYQALIAGLESALAAGCKALNIFLDSELIVRQVQGIYKVKNEQLQSLHVQVTDLLARMRSWQIRHVPREKNFRADELANKGIDETVQNQ
jgi:ribonuclease HI/probable phosphoglycerate mutase